MDCRGITQAGQSRARPCAEIDGRATATSTENSVYINALVAALEDADTAAAEAARASDAAVAAAETASSTAQAATSAATTQAATTAEELRDLRSATTTQAANAAWELEGLRGDLEGVRATLAAAETAASLRQGALSDSNAAAALLRGQLAAYGDDVATLTRQNTALWSLQLQRWPGVHPDDVCAPVLAMKALAADLPSTAEQLHSSLREVQLRLVSATGAAAAAEARSQCVDDQLKDTRLQLATAQQSARANADTAAAAIGSLSRRLESATFALGSRPARTPRPEVRSTPCSREQCCVGAAVLRLSPRAGCAARVSVTIPFLQAPPEAPPPLVAPSSATAHLGQVCCATCTDARDSVNTLLASLFFYCISGGWDNYSRVLWHGCRVQ